MTRALLAVLNHAETAPSVLACASLLAARLPGARIEALHARLAADPSFMPTEEVMTPERRQRFLDGEAARSSALRAAFDAWPGAAAATWREETGDAAALVARVGGQADLIVIGRAVHGGPEDGHAAIRAALLQTGALVLLAPMDPPDALGATIALAWKPSEAAERAVVAAAPLLRLAAVVTVLIGPGEGDDPALAEALAGALGPAGAPASVRGFELEGAGIGAALARAARAAGADLLVMGAYADHGPSAEALWGGATRDILKACDLAVLFHH